MGSIHDGLNGLLKLGIVNLVDHQSKDDGQREGCQVNQIDPDRIPQNAAEIGVVKETAKMLKAYPFTPPNPLAGSAVFGENTAENVKAFKEIFAKK